MLQPNPELQKSLHSGTELFKFKTHHVILAHRQVASEAVADFDPLIKRLRALKYLTDAAGGGHGHASKKDQPEAKDLLKDDPHFGSQLEKRSVQSVAFVGFTRNTLLEMARTAERVEEMGEEHNDCHVLPHGSLTDNHTDTLPLIGYFTTNF